jgi:hypothetical protein
LVTPSGRAQPAIGARSAATATSVAVTKSQSSVSRSVSVPIVQPGSKARR